MSNGYSTRGALIAGKYKARDNAAAARYRNHYHNGDSSKQAKQEQITNVLAKHKQQLVQKYTKRN